MTTFFSLRRAKAIAKKEFYHILRDPFTLASGLGLPLLMVVFFGIAIEFNVRNVPLAVSDSDQTQSSRALIETFGSSHYFLISRVHSPNQGVRDVTTEKTRAALIIPPRFEKDLFEGRGASVQVLMDGSDSSTVGPILSYIGKIQTLSFQKIMHSNIQKPFEIRTRYLFNSELNSQWFVIPGLNVIIMTILSILLTALTISREWENGSMELLLSTPVQPLEIIIGKLVPYGLLGIIAVSFVFLVARIIFHVPFMGNIFIYSLGFLIFLTTYLAQGLLISVVARNQQVAMQFAMMSGMLPTQLLSGFIFPIESMPTFFQYFTMIFPARWFMNISRDLFLKGSGFYELKGSFFALLLICFFMIAMGTHRFKRDLEK